MADVKAFLRSQLAKLADAEYERCLRGKTSDFDAWITQKESRLERTDMSLGFEAKHLFSNTGETGKTETVKSEADDFDKEEVSYKPEPSKKIKIKGLATGIDVDALSFIKDIENNSYEDSKLENEPADDFDDEDYYEEPVTETENVIAATADIDPEEYKHKSFVTRVGKTTFRIIPYEAVSRGFTVNSFIEDVIVFTNGELTPTALPLIAAEFEKNTRTAIVYGDEDIAACDDDDSRSYGEVKKGARSNPYFKPKWSPNAFLHRFYFCNIVAVKRAAFRDVDFSEGFKNTQTGVRYLYHTILRYVTMSESNMLGSVSHVSEILLHASDYDNCNVTDPSAQRFAKPLKNNSLSKTVTVVIPSKDNPDLLRQCIASVYNVKHPGIDVDIVVVDNGSNAKNREKIEKITVDYPFTYEYVKSEFNFSHMCNIGASLANGDFLLFLNDDVIITEPNTINAMLSEAEYKFTGAVGAKLLYPSSTTIQHAGVINNRIGPVHKLQFMDDSVSHYHGFNRFPQNLLAVTAACLMIRKDLFMQANGFDEELRVAFNDVDLCFRLFEAGYQNVCLNDISLVHCESFSRGHDTDFESIKRLMSERHNLYERHNALKAQDFYYGKYNVSDCLDTRIVPANTYEFSRAVSYAQKIKPFTFKDAREDECLKVTVEFSGELSEYTFGQFEGYDKGAYIQGFSFVIGSDNSVFDKFLLLQSETETFKVSYEPAYRDDLLNNCKDQVNIELCGFSVIIPDGKLPKGTYRIGSAAVKKVTGDTIISFSNREITVK